MSAPEPHTTPIQFVKGVGPQLGAVFAGRGITTVRDLLFFLPRMYQDRSELKSLSALADDDTATLPLTVANARRIPIARGKRMIFEVRASDNDGQWVNLKWFHIPHGLPERLKPGVSFFATGTLKKTLASCEIHHPELHFSKDSIHLGRIIPIYTEIEGISTRILRNILNTALTTFARHAPEDLPAYFTAKYKLPSLAEAIQQLHFPKELFTPETSPAFSRLVYEEFFKFEFHVLKRRLQLHKEHALCIDRASSDAELPAILNRLPFALTAGQSKALGEILSDLSHTHPMSRLLQGDVGSGKTAVALVTAALLLKHGGQAALMAPTEILAEQHLRSAEKLLQGSLPFAFLSGRTTAKERRALQERLSSGEPLLLIGTHALIEDPVQFKNLTLVIVDEQHRFGVEQRRKLRSKGTQYAPHTLVLSATPIPRTLALTAYGDLATSSIRELPPGRQPITTRVVRGAEERFQVLSWVKEQLSQGRQAYIIYPLVNESEAEGLELIRNAVAEAARLQAEVFRDYKVGLLHGQLKPAEKQEVMNQFKAGALHVLVSTTVVEVGVDVPNATVMIIEHAERFGLSQLHQLRGRIGRGTHASYCFLMTAERSGETARQRLNILEKTQDGFKIAEEDLLIRGPGEFLGIRQAGSLPFKVAELLRDREWLLRAREDVIQLLKEDPELRNPEHASFKRYLVREGRLDGERLVD